jgi:hypothetical protein
MSDEIIYKTFDNSKLTDDERWFAHVRDYGIFNDAQARLIADALIDVQVRARNDCKKEVEDLLEVLPDWLDDSVLAKMRSLHDQVGVARERLAMLEGQIRAMADLKGVPGKQGERGESGRQGARGEKGDPGPSGADGKSAPHWIGIKTDGFDLITVLSDGTLGPRISLQQMFAEFAKQLST